MKAKPAITFSQSLGIEGKREKFSLEYITFEMSQIYVCKCDFGTWEQGWKRGGLGIISFIVNSKARIDTITLVRN